MLQRIKFANINVLDLDRAVKFYTSKLGFAIHTDHPIGESRWVELRVGNAETLLVPVLAPDHKPSDQPALVLVASNVQDTYKELRGRGVQFAQPPKKEPWGEHAVLKDSEGNVLVIGSP
jgi:predicted enzyme related to lactoylglutathione lyase